MPGPRLSIGERDFIQAGLRAEMSVRAIAAELGRSPSTVSREIWRNRGLRGYRSCVAHYRAHHRARRPKAFKLELHPELACRVRRLLAGGGRRGRSRPGFAKTTLMIHDGGCLRKRSIERSTSRRGARCAMS
jgi:hypothetical protein